MSEGQMPVETIRKRVLRRDGPVCQWCGIGLKKDEITYDHIIPKAVGGKNAMSNLCVCCSQCNVRKGDADWGRPDGNYKKDRPDGVRVKLDRERRFRAVLMNAKRNMDVLDPYGHKRVRQSVW